MGWSITWHFVENVILGPFASAWFAALMVKKAEPSDPASPVRTEPPALLRRLTISSDAAHYVSVSLLVVLFYLCASDKLYTALHTQSLYYLWHYWPV